MCVFLHVWLCVHIIMHKTILSWGAVAYWIAIRTIDQAVMSSSAVRATACACVPRQTTLPLIGCVSSDRAGDPFYVVTIYVRGINRLHSGYTNVSLAMHATSLVARYNLITGTGLDLYLNRRINNRNYRTRT